MPTGQTKTLRQAHQGQTAKAYKVWKDKDGNEISREEYNTTHYNAYGQRIAVGTLNPDGSHATFDKSTGEITSGAVSPTPTPSPTPAAATPTQAPAAPTQAPATPTPEPPPPATPTPEPPADPTPVPEPPTDPPPVPDPPQPENPDPNNGGGEGEGGGA